jgi:carbon-monoxide dehydrogenase small subunit
MQEQEEITPLFTEEYDIAMTVNGHRYERRVPVRLLLSDFLRHELHHTGTHVNMVYVVAVPCF